MSLPKPFAWVFQQVNRTIMAKPSPSLCRLYELSLDCAIVLLQKARPSQGAVRYDWSDSSPQAKYDWLWSQFREIKECNLIDLFWSTIYMEDEMERVRDDIKAGAYSDQADDGDEGLPDDATKYIQPLPGWKPHLEDIANFVHEHTNLPAALASGQSGLAHKAEAKVFGWALLSPPGEIKEHAESYAAGTYDMGTELGLVRFQIPDGNVASLLPTWFDSRKPMQCDIDLASESSEIVDGVQHEDLNVNGQVPRGDDRARGSDSDELDGPPCEGSSLGSDIDGPMLCDVIIADAASDAGDADTRAPDSSDAAFPPIQQQSWKPGDAGTSANVLMANGITIAELQHICDNAQSLIHTELEHWNEFWLELKVFEGLLGCPERMRRYMWTCVRGTRLAWTEDKLNGFSATLYEKRWKEVVNFLKQLRPRLNLIHKTWNQAKYLQGVDGDRNAFEPTAQEKSAHAGLPSFDPHALTGLLQGSMFPVYGVMVLIAENATVQLATWAESCPCHEPLFAKLSRYNREHMYSFHFGKGFKTCPNAGCHLPDLVAGELDARLDGLWEHQEAKLATVTVIDGAPPLTSTEWSTLLGDFRKSKSMATVYMKMKLNYVNRLPVSLAVLAHRDESLARTMGAQHVAIFEADPREELYDEITWALLHPGAAFLVDVKKFFAGMPRANLQRSTLMTIAAWKFVPIVGTTIENKHLHVSIADKAHALGPVRVSLANRLPMLERWLERGAVKVADLLEYFEAAREIKQIPSLLGFSDHPDLKDLHSMSTFKARKAISQIMYRCDLSHLYHSLKVAGKAHAKVNVKRKRDTAAFLAKDCKRRKVVADEHSVTIELMRDHFSQIHGSGSDLVFVVPQSSVRTETTTTLLTTPAAQRISDADEDANHAIGLDIEADSDAENIAVEGLLYFKVALHSPGQRSMIPVSVGAGGNVPRGIFAVTLHQAHRTGTGDIVIDGLPMSIGKKKRESVMFLDLFSKDGFAVKEHCVSHNTVSSLWHIASTNFATIDDEIRSRAITSMMNSGAYPGPHVQRIYRPNNEEMRALQCLVEDGLVCRAGGMKGDTYGVSLTMDGISALVACPVLSPESQRVFAVRPNLALGDRTSFELVEILRADGWTWREWIPPSRRTRKMEAIPDGFSAGESMIWFSTAAVVKRNYLLILLDTEAASSVM
jgi:hypothetical protein